ncbi:spore coat protein H [Lachnospiraceae bacterium]|nr:spore coat protein H [Lachnospiraceae bacterium]
MKKETQKFLSVVLALCIVMVISWQYGRISNDSPKNTPPEEVKEADASDAASEAKTPMASDEIKFDTSNSKHLSDFSYLYEDNGDSYVTMYLTVRKGNKTEGTDHTWKEVNAHSVYYYEEKDIDRYKIEGLLQVGDENGPLPGLLGYGKKVPNAIVQIRGQSSSTNTQKNYKIELKPNQGSWNGQTTIALNKHVNDGLRFRNKMGFDLLSGIDELMSLRTTFVHLYVNDLTDEESDGFRDYGLYTQVEQLNKTALKNHGLDKTGHLYKVNFFEFYRYEDVIKLATDPDYDEKKFETYLEIKGASDHTKLIEMLKDVNDYTIPIDDVIEKHFDMENLTYWLAFNILTGNADTQSRNFYLYSAQNEKTWYLYSWDLDGMFRYDENRLTDINDFESWERGVSNYWGNVLFQRCLKSSKFRDQLDSAIHDLKDYLSKERLSGMIAEYRKVAKHFAYSEPDLTYMKLTEETYDEIAAKLPDLVDTYYGFYSDSLQKPMPFFIYEPEVQDGKLKVGWEASYDFQEEELSYTACLSRNPDGTDVVGEYTGKWTEATFDMPSSGEYFLKVYASDESGNTQDAFDRYEVEGYGKYYGVICFYINSNGTIGNYETEE